MLPFFSLHTLDTTGSNQQAYPPERMFMATSVSTLTQDTDNMDNNFLKLSVHHM